jgi:hypothetical protein
MSVSGVMPWMFRLFSRSALRSTLPNRRSNVSKQAGTAFLHRGFQELAVPT